jgi:transketolase
MASCGKMPFIYTAGAFLAYRSFEFIRDDVCLQEQNVKIVGMGSGLAWSTLGATHHTTEDISVLRALPGLTIFSPACPSEVQQVVHAAYEITGPVYIRLGMGGEPEIYDESYTFKTGSCIQLKSGNDIAIFSTGSIISEVLKAANKLEEHDIKTRVINIHTLKPIDRDAVINAAMETKIFFSVEEHNIYGGLGSIIAEILSDAGIGIKLGRIGLSDIFAAGYGNVQTVRKMNGLDSESIYNTIFNHIKKGNYGY